MASDVAIPTKQQRIAGANIGVHYLGAEQLRAALCSFAPQSRQQNSVVTSSRNACQMPPRRTCISQRISSSCVINQCCLLLRYARRISEMMSFDVAIAFPPTALYSTVVSDYDMSAESTKWCRSMLRFQQNFQDSVWRSDTTLQ